MTTRFSRSATSITARMPSIRPPWSGGPSRRIILSATSSRTCSRRSFPLVMKGVKQLKTFGETGFHCLAAARVADRYPREAFACGLRILGEGQLSLTKFLIVTDGNIDVADFPKTLAAYPGTDPMGPDLFVFANVSQDTLDYTGPSVNKGSKAMIMGLGRTKRRELPQAFSGTLPAGCSHPHRLSARHPGCPGNAYPCRSRTGAGTCPIRTALGNGPLSSWSTNRAATCSPAGVSLDLFHPLRTSSGYSRSQPPRCIDSMSAFNHPSSSIAA